MKTYILYAVHLPLSYLSGIFSVSLPFFGWLPLWLDGKMKKTELVILSGYCIIVMSNTSMMITIC